jgi:hypothetical protein
MLPDPKLRSQVDALGDKFWTGTYQFVAEFASAGRMFQSTRQVEGLFESLLAEAFS